MIPHQVGEWKSSEPGIHLAQAVQTENRQRFQKAFSRGLAVVGFLSDNHGNGIFELAPFEHVRSSSSMRIDAIFLRELRIPLVKPFETSFGVTTDRRILLVELEIRRPHRLGRVRRRRASLLRDETIDTAWLMLVQELAPALARSEPAHAGKVPGILQQVRGHRMAKAALENSVWDLEAQMRGISLAELLGGIRETIPCGVSIGIQPSIEELLDEIETELAAGYQRIKLKCKPGWDTEVFDAVRNRWPDITLSCDANSAYRMKDVDTSSAGTSST